VSYVVGEKVSERQEVGSALSSALLTISVVSEVWLGVAWDRADGCLPRNSVAYMNTRTGFAVDSSTKADSWRGGVLM
jgi:hypothetical protein